MIDLGWFMPGRSAVLIHPNSLPCNPEIVSVLARQTAYGLGDSVEMKKFIMAAVGACMLTFGMGSASAQTVGDWVLGNYQNSGYWFAGVISNVDGDKITIRYDDGDLETVYPNAVRPYNWAVGTRVECNYQGAGDWYAGKITALNVERLSIAYDDGDAENTTTGMCRSR